MTFIRLQGPEWVENNIIVTAHKDGAVRIWSVNYRTKPVRVPQATHNAPMRELFVRTTLPAKDVTCVHISSYVFQ